jgi:hypothetical protein
MNDETKNIVASNLTVALYSGSPKSRTEDEILGAYHHFLARLSPDKEEVDDSGFVGAMPETGLAR